MLPFTRPTKKAKAITVSTSDQSESDLEKCAPPVYSSPRDEVFSGLRRLLISTKGTEAPNAILESCWTWYCRYLNRSIESAWSIILSPLVRDLDVDYPVDCVTRLNQLNIVYQILETILIALRSRDNVSLDGIAEELFAKQLLRARDDPAFSQALPHLRQMVWCLVGTLTMLYDPSRDCQAEKLKLRNTASNLRAGGLRRSSDLFASQQDAIGGRDPLHSLLGQFGDLIPRVEVDAAFLASADQDYINIAYINFYTLKRVAKLEIEWVDTLNMHLQLDKRKRILRLYRFPAFCRLLWSDSEDSFLERLFMDHRFSQVSEQDITENTISEYFREIILSYRLLFGIDRRSRYEFRGELQSWNTYDSEVSTPPPFHVRNAFLDPGSIIRQRAGRASSVSPSLPATPSTTPPSRSSLPPEQDPLLSLLTETDISHNNNSTVNQNALIELLSLLHGEERGSTMFDLEDFPFLGSRLAELQRFSLIQKPNDLRSIFLVDRRDTHNFWNGLIACALLFIGGATIILQTWTVILQLCQLGFQIWGTLIARAQTKA